MLGSLRQVLDQQQDTLRDTVLRNALLGTFSDEAELLADIQSVGLAFDAQWYYVVNVLLLRPDEMMEEPPSVLPYRAFLKQFFYEAMPVDFVMCDIGGSFTLLLPSKEGYSQKELKNIFREISKKIERMDWVAPSFAVSEGCRELSKLHEPYKQTCVVEEYLTCLDLYGVFLASELPGSDEHMCLTIDNELRFMQLLNTDSPEDLEEFWCALVVRNITKRRLSPDMLVNMRERLRHCLLRTLAAYAGNEEIAALTKTVETAKSLEGIYRCAVQTQSTLVRKINEQDNQSNAETKTMLRAAVEEHFANPMFSLYMLAELAGMQENTLYRAFKGYYGRSFSSYLEQYRINKAFELLRSQVPVKEVAARVGYTSDHSFRRAFKRVMKIPPSQFGVAE